MINAVNLAEEKLYSNQCELCGRNCQIDEMTRSKLNLAYQFDDGLPLLCIICRSKLTNYKDLQKKYDKLESKIDCLNRKIILLSSIAEKHNSCPTSHYNSIYYQSSPTTDNKRKFVKLLFHGKKIDNSKKVHSSPNQNLTSELKTPLNYTETCAIINNNDRMKSSSKCNQLMVSFLVMFLLHV